MDKAEYAVFLLPFGILGLRALFRDEMLYVYLAKLVRENPSLIYPWVPIYIPHPPVLWYRLALFLFRPRLGAFLLASISAYVFYKVEPRAKYAIGSALPAFYSSIVFDDASGAFLAAAASTAAYKKRYREAALILFAASFVRFQSAAIAALYIGFLGLKNRDKNLIVPLAAIPSVALFFLVYPRPLRHLNKPSYIYSFTMYFLLLRLPYTLLPLIPLIYKDRESLRIITVSYVFNSLTRNVFDRYYLTAIDFAAARIHEPPKRYPRLLIVSGLSMAINTSYKISWIFLLASLPLIAIPKLKYQDAYIVYQRVIAFYLSIYAYYFALPHPCMRWYRSQVS